MTITKYDRVAILPKRCDGCNRLFWLEPYNIFYKTVGIESYSLKQIECQKCIDNKIESEEQDPCDTCGYEEGGIYCKEHCPHEAKIEREPKTEKWIPVKESLPKTAREVRVTDGTDVFIGWYDGTEWCSSSELFWPDTDPITAWMPYHIPKPYKKESENKA